MMHATRARTLLAAVGLAAALLAAGCDTAQQVPWASYDSALQPRIDAATTSTAHEKATGFRNDALVAYIQASQHEAGCPSAGG